MRVTFRKTFNYFLKGLIITIPVVLTVVLLIKAISWIDGLLGIAIPGVGTILLISGITLIGYIGSGLITKPLFELFTELLEKAPGIKFIYSSIKDLMEAFVGEKKKFNQPVAVEMTDSGVLKLGFITQKELTQLGIEEYVAVYFPHSYNFSGNLFLIPSKKIKPIEGNSSTIMKFVVSGGITDLD